MVFVGEDFILFWLSAHLLYVALHEGAAEHGRHPVAARDEQGLMGRQEAVVQPKHHI